MFNALFDHRKSNIAVEFSRIAYVPTSGKWSGVQQSYLCSVTDKVNGSRQTNASYTSLRYAGEAFVLVDGVKKPGAG